MRKWLLYLEFFLVCGYFVIIPLFMPSPDISDISFNLTPVFILMTGLSFYLFYRYEFSLSERQNLNFLTILLNTGKVLFYFGILIIINIAVSAVSALVQILRGLPVDVLQSNLSINTTDLSFLDWLSGIFKFLISAFFEESLYRLFLPAALLIFTQNLRIRFPKVVRFLIEAVCVVVFALGHRYMGIVAVVNALISGTALRVIYFKNKSILYGFSAHFLYNIFILVLMIVLKN